MPTSAERMANLPFKKLSGREYTSTNKAIYEENGTVAFKVKGADVWIEPIPEDPANIDPLVVRKLTLTMTEDTTVAGSLSYKAIKDSQQLGAFVPPRYGQGYTAVLTINGTKILTTHSCGWNFDYESGLLTFLSTPPGTSTRSVVMDFYQYIGKTADDLSHFDAGLGNLIINYSYVTE